MFERFKEAGQHTLIFGIGTSAIQAAGLILLPLYTNYLTPAEFGVLNLLLIAREMIAMIPSTSVRAALFRSFYDYDTAGERAVVVSTALFLAGAFAGILVLIGISMAPWLSLLLTGSTEYTFLTIIALGVGLLKSIDGVALAVFRAEKWSWKYVIVSLSAMLVSLGLTIYFLVFLKLQITGALLGILSANVVSAILTLFLIRHYLRPTISRLEIKKMIKYGAPFIPSSSAQFLQDIGDRLLVQSLLGTEAVGLYALAKQFGRLLQLVIINPFTLIRPALIFSAEKDPQAKEFYGRLLTYFLLAASFVATGIAVLADDVLRLFTPETYWTAAAIIPWICLAYIVVGANGLFSVGLELKRKTFWYPLASLLGLAVYFSMLVILTERVGLTGAGIALALGYLVTVAFGYWRSQQIYPVRLESGRIFKVALVSLILLGVGQVISLWAIPIWLALPVKFCTVLIGFPVLLLLFRFPDGPEMAKLQELITLYKQKAILLYHQEVAQ